MENLNFVAIDFETATYDRMPCQLGIVIVENGEVVEKGIFLIRPPGNRYDYGCINVHGIYPKDTENSSEFDEIWEFLSPYLQNKIIVAHNISFDLDVLAKILTYYHLPDFEYLDAICTKDIFCGRSLEDVCEALGIPLEKHHDAFCDAWACSEIYIRYLNGVDPHTLNYPERKPSKKISFHEKQEIKSDTKIQDLSIVENRNTIFYDKKIVLSGVFAKYPDKNDLGVLLKKYGADINTSISSKTQIFITGGYGVGPIKMQKVLDLIEKGINIQIIEEQQLYKILSSI